MIKTLILFFITINTAIAGIWIEPYIGYKFGSYDATLKNYVGAAAIANGDYTVDMTGYAVGGKLGYAVPFLAIGLEYQMGQLNKKINKKPAASTLVDNDRYDTTVLGAFVTFTAIPLINVWAGYQFSIKWKDTNGPDKGDTISGSGYGVGAGFTGLPFLSINLDYKAYTMNKEKSGGTTTNLPSNNKNEYEGEEIMLSISLPFNI